MKRTLKFKIVFSFTVVLILVSAVALAVLDHAARDILIKDQKTNIQIAVKEFAKKIYGENGQLFASAGAHFYERGVYRQVFDSEGTPVLGESPAELQGISFSFENNAVREKNEKGNFYLEYDLCITVDGRTWWVKGIALLNDEICTIEATIKSGIVVVCILVAVAVIGACFIISRALAPVEKIRKTAKQIAQSYDLSKRIGLGKEKDEIGLLANTFDEMLDKLEQAFAREKQFTSDVSHELRTPIAVILSECEYARSCGKTQEEYAESIAVINRQADRMQKMVSELLAISRMESNTNRTEFEMTDISELLSFVCDEQEEIQNPRIVLHRQITPGVVAKADRELLARLFINLIVNAYQYSKETGTITVSLEKTAENIVFSVRDTGVGIPEKDLPMIWDRFYRGDYARSVNEHNSMGLGLALVKRIAQEHRGDVCVASKPGEGSEFVFSFPVE